MRLAACRARRVACVPKLRSQILHQQIDSRNKQLLLLRRLHVDRDHDWRLKSQPTALNVRKFDRLQQDEVTMQKLNAAVSGRVKGFARHLTLHKAVRP